MTETELKLAAASATIGFNTMLTPADSPAASGMWAVLLEECPKQILAIIFWTVRRVRCVDAKRSCEWHFPDYLRALFIRYHAVSRDAFKGD